MINAIWFVLAGMGVVFLTLAVLALVMTLLNRWLTEQGGPATHRPASGGTDPQTPCRA